MIKTPALAGVLVKIIVLFVDDLLSIFLFFAVIASPSVKSKWVGIIFLF